MTAILFNSSSNIGHGAQHDWPLRPPPSLSDATHIIRCLAQLHSKGPDIEKYIFLLALKAREPRMFYRLCVEHMKEVVPLIYTPTVGQACQEYSHIYRRPEGLIISIKDKGNIGAILGTWANKAAARISVVTDGSRILGLGDLGVNGMPISVGKLSLYVACAGIHPSSAIPICLDFGTNTQKHLDDPLYLGLRQKRVPTEEMTEFMDEFMDEMSVVFPKLLVQFEDFSTDHAFKYLDRYRSGYPVFNDDIQGTGAVVLSGFINAAKLSSAASSEPLTAQRILFFGAGSAGVGVAMQLLSFFTMEGMTEDEARRRVWLVDSKGLVYTARGQLAEHKKYFARTDYIGPPLTSLLSIIDYVRPTALIGLSTIPGTFTPEVLRAMASISPRPIVFPLSNPVALSECTFAEALKHTQGNVLFASGSPFEDMLFDGTMRSAGQGNNMYIFPGLGLGAILSRAGRVTDSMVEASALGLANSLSAAEEAAGLLYPRIERIREISAQVAMRVVRAAQEAGVDRNPALRALNDPELHMFVKSHMWDPRRAQGASVGQRL
ncbi:hypothetical protein FB45DRAFT_919738 [Roridomyces roridus]|uniref:Malic enzyme n=1 Tax=Roridomyces roridus TaxID=1738132 RepID=A0AAD7FK95_9AGAR|nr:hypothetical protein FB45DRAFT_919738 [Roridomyces roridus]